jgi:transcriptional regulator with PAS, ATPase and Fis domain
VGSNQVKSSNVRIIAATNRDLKERIEQKMMREDFFYRIHILPIQLPALRDRKEDLDLLIDHFLSLYAGKRNLPPITGKLMERLLQYDWPGNVRELQNVIIRYCNQKRIDLMGSMSKPVGSMSRSAATPHEALGVVTEQSVQELNEMVAKYEKNIIISALNQNRWHRQKVAEVLNIDRKTLFNKMKRYGLVKSAKEHGAHE